MSNQLLHDQDFYAWANEQAELLRAGRLSEADIEHIAEEIESMGKSEKRELVNRLAILLTHLLTWRYQPSRRGHSWRLTMKEQRTRLKSHMKDNPSLKAILSEAIEEAYLLGVIGAARETRKDLGSFPAVCPWSYDQLIDPDFWPSADA